MSQNLEGLLIDMLMAGADRGALVNPHQPGVLVLMLSKAAIRAMGPPLIAYLKTLGDTADKAEIAKLTVKAPLGEFFRATAASAPFGYAWFAIRYFDVEVLAACVIGEDRCLEVARICTAAGAPCSMDPKKPAPGWEIDRHVHLGPKV